MNNLSATDILLYGALAGAVLVAIGAVLWACAYRGRTRFKAERIEVITARPGDAVVVTYPGALTDEQRMHVVRSMEPRMPKGVNVMVLEGGLRMSHVVSLRDAPESLSPGHVPPRPMPQRRPVS